MTTAQRPQPMPLHALWRPGVGLGVWHIASSGRDGGHFPAPDDATGPEPVSEGGGLPDAVSALLAGRRFRRPVPIVDADGGRRLVATMTLGTPSAVSFLDLTRDIPVSGEIRWYQRLLDAVRQVVAAGAVAPAMLDVDGEPLMRWTAVPTTVWCSWLTVAVASAPGVIADNDVRAAVDDLVAELVDHQCRTRLRSAAAVVEPRGLVAALLPDADQHAPVAETRRAEAFSAWARWNAGAAHHGPDLLLRLHEPDDDGPVAAAPPDVGLLRWRLQVCRRGADGQVEPVAPHTLDAHDLDTLTSGLAGALRAFPVLGQADTDPHTLDYLLTTEQAELLFSDGAAALAEAGVPVLLPRTIAEVRPALHVRAHPSAPDSARARMVGLAEIRAFEWRLALGDVPGAAELSESDLDDLAGQRGDLVRLRGVWVRAHGAALTRAATFVRAQQSLPASEQPADFGDLFGLLTGDSDRLPAPLTSVRGLDWLDEVGDTGGLRPQPLSAPPGLRTDLRPYQHRGLEWLAHLSDIGVGGVLADDMGLGKTVQVIALICHERSRGPATDVTAEPPVDPTLIVCPMSVIGNWQREIARFAPDLSVAVHHGPARDAAGSGETWRDADVVLTTYATARRDRVLLADHIWRRLVVDEAQHVKNVATGSAKALRAIPSRHRVALTGTPVENRLEDLRSVIDLVNPGLLGGPSTFRARFAEPIERDRDPAALRRLTSITRPFILRREKTDPAVVGDLPEKSEMTVRANLTVEQAALYRAVIDDLMAALRNREQRVLRRRTVLAALTRLKQICNHPAHYLADGSSLRRRGEHRSGKVELLADMASTLIAEGDRALVFTQFAAFGELLSGWLSEHLGAEVPMLHGGLGRADRDRVVADFQNTSGPPVLVATLRAGGTGLNLTAANQVIHADRWWNPAVEDQATDRAHRIGQRRRVEVSRFVCIGTIEERIDDMIAAKRELSRLTVSAGEAWLADLDDDDLFDLFRLRDEAVGE